MRSALFAFALFATAAQAQDGALETLRVRAAADSTAHALVEELTTRFGARPAGSVNERQAAQWGARKLRDFGFGKVDVEPFALHLWEPGTTRVELLGALPQRFEAVALGGLDAGASVEADTVVFASYKAFLDAAPESVRGRIVAVLEPTARTQDGSGYGRALMMRIAGPGEAQRRGAVGYLMRSLATHESRTASSGATAPLGSPFPAFALSPPDATQLERLAGLGPVRLRLASDAGWRGTTTSQNVVGEIAGRDASARALLVSAHLDSWDQGTGALDDGFGIAAVTAAAKLVNDLPQRPRRTIRLVWFGAEEVSQPAPSGNFAGARAYVERHREELARIGAVAESDGGGGKVVEIALGANAALAKKLEAALGIRVDPRAPGNAGPDVGVLQAAGIPGFRLRQDASAQYDSHHNANDVLQAVDKDSLNQNVAAWAIALWLLAESEEELAAPAK